MRRSYEDAGVVAGANPCNHEDVKGTMAALKIILGSARGSLPDIISCEVAQRLLSILDAENLRDVTMAVMVAEGAALGERGSTRGLRDFGHCQLSKEGVAIHINYHKSDKEQKGCDAGIMHSSACVPGGLNVVRDERGVMRFSIAHFCAACVHDLHVKTLLLTFPGMTLEDISNQPLFADWVVAESVPAGATAVKAPESNSAFVAQLRDGVTVITRDQEKAGLLYRGEPLISLSPALSLVMLGITDMKLRALGGCAGEYTERDVAGGKGRSAALRRVGAAPAELADMVVAEPVDTTPRVGAALMEVDDAPPAACEPGVAPGEGVAAEEGGARAPEVEASAGGAPSPAAAEKRKREVSVRERLAGCGNVGRTSRCHTGLTRRRACSSRPGLWCVPLAAAARTRPALRFSGAVAGRLLRPKAGGVGEARDQRPGEGGRGRAEFRAFERASAEALLGQVLAAFARDKLGCCRSQRLVHHARGAVEGLGDDAAVPGEFQAAARAVQHGGQRTRG